MRAVLLDALGTLLALEDPAPRLVAELATRGVDVDRDAARAALRAEIAYYRAHHHTAVDAASLGELRERCTEVLRAALPPAAREIDDLRDALLASLRFTPFPEVVDVLAGLRRRGLRLIVVSNWDVSLHEALSAAGLARHVDAAISSAEAGAAKPAPAIFHAALGLAGGVAPQDAVHVGDEAALDVVGARAAGITPLLIARPPRSAPADLPFGVGVIEDLRALLSMVA
jgi:putative hydrolase of the HAD superfamily